MLKRKVWPIAAGADVALWIVTLILGWVTVFVDSRWEGFIPAFGMFALFGMAGVLGLAIGDVTYEKKPRGWRKERRRAEKEAYVRRLEQELLND